ncbi:branched-chain alpha-keto acid dehydrogenase subunit E2 [Mangrovactinospora gilvigrisea]|uniref:Dihydrolipoamide acetyltransferase component of pyruvate dehydrogenase complex n=1 Tax=Mangrovactinospora gilvigrisea TaxID=1428644 RepID=A0A1J7CET8_9ACTN|nr:dihydrolipoamide acetyltransferase family protein [Mangrovactinospora gilvigrisea]OIV38202.1 branched-chain alpha-keto acid dehydrogenase subunit E2 [Mangrovactinospora gilvigrisea]
MDRDYLMPDIGEGLTEGEILKWYVAEGDTVHDGQVVCEVETAKAAVELPIPYDGVVRKLHFAEGTTVDVGTPIVTVGTDAAEPAPAAPAAPAAPEGEPEEKHEVLVGYGLRGDAPVRRRAPKAAPEAPAAATPAAPVAPAANGRPSGRVLTKPPVRKLARDLGVDLAEVRPTGPGGLVTREDVRLHAEAGAPPAAAVAAAPVAPAAAEDVRIPIRGVRKATAQAMVASKFTAPHVTEFLQVDVTRTMKLVRKLKESKDFEGVRVSPLLMVARALLTAIRRHPEVNASWDEPNQEIVVRGDVNLGIAAATPRGLIVPNIKGAQRLTLLELAQEMGRLTATAREGRTAPADMQRGTVTITNVGVFGVDTGTPILNPGEAAILAFGAVREMPWVHKGKVRPRQVTTLALSFDHRLVDGELGSRVLADVGAVLGDPDRLIAWS